MLSTERRYNLLNEFIFNVNQTREAGAGEEPFIIAKEIAKTKEESLFLWELTDLIFKPRKEEKVEREEKQRSSENIIKFDGEEPIPLSPFNLSITELNHNLNGNLVENLINKKTKIKFNLFTGLLSLDGEIIYNDKIVEEERALFHVKEILIDELKHIENDLNSKY